ncbi:MAG: 50S ribosomal protein L25 [Flavobacteriales bacterium]
MKSFAISAEARETNKIANRALRNQGKVPCVLYGGEKQVYFSTKENVLNKLVNTPNVYIVEIEDGKDKYKAVLQDIQFHPLTDQILHVDFLQVFDDKEVTLSIPVNFIGTPIGVRNGGNLKVIRRAIKTRALPANLPDAIEINIEDMKIGKVLYIGDIRSDKYAFLESDRAVIVAVKMARGAVEEEGDEEGDESAEAEGAETPAE